MMTRTFIPRPRLAAVACGAALLALGASPARAQEMTGSRGYPLSPAPVKVPKITVDTSDNPDAKAWAADAQTVVRDWFPVLWRLLATEKQTPPSEIKLIFKKKIDAPAYASGDAITVNGEWITRHPDDMGMMIHELTHVIQAYPDGGDKPGWLVEGIADFIRWWRYEPEAPRPRIDPLKASYRDSYRTTAYFLAWITHKYDKGIVPKLDRALRTGTYKDEIFKTATGKDLDTLWSEFAPKPVAAR